MNPFYAIGLLIITGWTFYALGSHTARKRERARGEVLTRRAVDALRATYIKSIQDRLDAMAARDAARVAKP